MTAGLDDNGHFLLQECFEWFSKTPNVMQEQIFKELLYLKYFECMMLTISKSKK